MMRYLLVLMVMLVSLTGCQAEIVGKGWEKKVDPDPAAYAVLTYAVPLQHQKRLFLEDSQIFYDDKINKFHMEFSSQAILELREARELIVDLVEGFLVKVNNSDLKYELKSFPLTAKDVDVCIFFESFEGKYIDYRYTALIKLECGVVHFYEFDMENRLLDWWHDRSEYYWQSLLFVNASRAGEAEYRKDRDMKSRRALEHDMYKP